MMERKKKQKKNFLIVKTETIRGIGISRASELCMCVGTASCPNARLRASARVCVRANRGNK